MATSMKIHYWKSKLNFGDQLNPYLWPKLFPNFFDETSNTWFVGIGSILWPALSDAPAYKHVFGSGFSGHSALPIIDDKWQFHFVRGPLTARLLALDPSLALTDPAILVHGFQSAPKSIPISFMPHVSHDTPALHTVCTQLGIHYISPQSEDVEAIMRQISSSELVLAEAMHGAIVADALRVPWIPVEIHTINRHKWRDWCSSLEMEYRPQGYLKSRLHVAMSKVIQRIPRLEKLYFTLVLKSLMQSKLEPSLSKDKIFEMRLAQVWDKVNSFRVQFT